MKITFAFPTNRQSLLNEVKKGLTPDNALYGFNYFDNKTVVECEVNPKLERILDVVFYPINKVFMRQIDIDFKLARAILMTHMLNKSDVIVSNIDGMSLAICFLKRLGIVKRPIVCAIGLFYIQGKMLEGINKHRNSLFLKFYKWTYGASDQILYHAEIEKQKLQKLSFLDPAKTTFIAIGSDNKFFKQSQNKTKLKNGYIVSVGKDRARDYETLISAAKKLPNFKFVIVCRKLNVQEIDVPPNVQLLFNIPYKKVNDFYHLAQLVVIPIREMHRSSGQMTLTDCFQAGVPVIISKVVGISHYSLVNNTNCLLVTPGDSAQLTQAIRSLMTDSILRQKFVNNTKKISGQFTTRHYAEELKKVIRSAVDENQLVPITINDLNYLREIRNNNKDYFLTNNLITENQQKLWHESYSRKNAQGLEYMYIFKVKNRPCGTGAIYDIDHKLLQAKIGRFIIEKSLRGKGYGDILLKKITYVAFEKLNLKRVDLEVLASNKQAVKLYLKSGFKPYKKQTEKGRQIILMSRAKNT
jgi:RimJ/RimL family protein N-acetyltransferase